MPDLGDQDKGAQNPVNGRCKLCRRREQLRHSHIISKFALRDAQGNDPKPLLRVTNVDAPRPPLEQSWDQEYLLCGGCEERRRRWEAIVAATIAGRADGREQRPDLYVDPGHPRDMVRAEYVRYGPVKLWVLSTLFLMHHAARPDWAQVALSVDEEDRLRRRLHSGDPGSDLDFQIFGTITTRSPFDAEERGGIIVPGYLTESRNGYTRTRMGHFSALDCHWAVLLGDWPDNPMRDARLRADGTWRVLRDTEDEAMVRAARKLNLIL